MIKLESLWRYLGIESAFCPRVALRWCNKPRCALLVRCRIFVGEIGPSCNRPLDTTRSSASLIAKTFIRIASMANAMRLTETTSAIMIKVDTSIR